MKDYINIGSSPTGEICAQLGSPGYEAIANTELRIFANQLRRQFGKPPEGAKIIVKGFEHDFGRYYEVCIAYDDAMPQSVAYAYYIENHTPEFWDLASLDELEKSNVDIDTIEDRSETIKPFVPPAE